MIYFFVNKDGTEGCANECPIRKYGDYWDGWEDMYYTCSVLHLPKGTIEKLIGRVLTWDNEPYYYTGNEEYDRLNNPTYYES